MKQAIIVGAGHAGLATAYLLKQKGYSEVLILEASDRLGSAWRKRYAGLTLFTSKRYCQLPGMAMDGEQSEYPDKDEFVEYLEQYAAKFELNIRFKVEVIGVRYDQQRFTVTSKQGETFSCNMLFVCSGAFQTPNFVKLSSHSFYQDKVFTPETVGNRHLTSENQNWLVIGDGASGRQLAKMLAEKNQVLLSTGKPRAFLPQRLFGQDIFFWLDKLKVLRLSKRHWLAKKIQKKDPIPASGIRNHQLTNMGVTFCKRFELNRLNNETQLRYEGRLIDNVIVATGYKNDFSWLRNGLEGKDSEGELCEEISNISGLYILSQPWLNSRGSGLIIGIEHDFNSLNLLEC